MEFLLASKDLLLRLMEVVACLLYITSQKCQGLTEHTNKDQMIALAAGAPQGDTPECRLKLDLQPMPQGGRTVADMLIDIFMSS